MLLSKNEVTDRCDVDVGIDLLHQIQVSVKSRQEKADERTLTISSSTSMLRADFAYLHPALLETLVSTTCVPALGRRAAVTPAAIVNPFITRTRGAGSCPLYFKPSHPEVGKGTLTRSIVGERYVLRISTMDKAESK